MKKTAIILLAVLLCALTFLPGCKKAESNEKTIRIGATSTPHGEILEHVKSALAEKGYTLDIVIYDDYVLPNKALADGELDANYFQHTPYLNSYNADNKTDLVSAASIHYEPFCAYGKDIASFGELKEGATVIVPADDSNETRALLLLAQENVITLKDGVKALTGVTVEDIEDDHGYNIVPVQADTVPAQFGNTDSGSAAVINGNYALAAGFKIEDAIAIESAEGDAAQTYANVIAVRKGDENSEKIKALIEVLTTDDVASFIDEKYNGAVIKIF